VTERSFWPGRLLLLALACTLGVVSPAFAQELPPETSEPVAEPSVSMPLSPPAGPAPLAVTISGGGTLGAYMAGELYYMGLASRTSKLYEPRVFTGASAGSINAFISALTSCSAPQVDPTRSMFWKVWIPAGIREFFPKHHKDGTSLLSPSGFDAGIEHLRSVWNAGLPADCDVLYGVAITRAKPLDVQLAPGFPAVPRSLETVMLRVRGQGMGKVPLLTNYIDPAKITPQILLPLSGPDAKGFDSLRQLALASSAFPIGFPPVSLRHCLLTHKQSPLCTPKEATEALFIDGGVFDNQPLGLAVRAMRGIEVRASGKLLVKDVPDPKEMASRAHFYFLDPRVKGYPTVPPAEEKQAVDDVLGVLSGMFSMIDSVRSSELISIFDQNPEIRERLLLGRTFFPPASGTFTGFLDRSFREFDFYLGMYDAARTVQGYLTDNKQPQVVELLLKGVSSNGTSWKPFLCLRAVLDGEGDVSSCAGDELKNFRILLQHSLDRLHNECKNILESGVRPATTHRQCLRSMAGEPVTHVPGVRVLAARETSQGAEESLLQYQLRLLGRYGFHFRDLGLSRGQAKEAKTQLIRLGQKMVRRLSLAQPRNGLLLGVVGRVGVDTALGYLPPQHMVHFVFGLGAEAGYSTALGVDWLRLATAVGLDGFSTLLNSSENYLAVAPKLGLEIEVLSGSRLQLRLGARAGYQFSTADSLSRGTCDVSREQEAPCSRLLTEAYASATVLGIFRVQVAGVYAPPVQSGQKRLFAVNPMLGIQINSPF
jgi:predicted acylesterase/phospholipase RssA